MNKVRFFLALSLCFNCCVALAEIQRQFSLPVAGNDLVGANSTTTTAASDTLVDIAARNLLGYNTIRSANPHVDAWLPGEGTTVLLPFRTILPAISRAGIVINVAEMRLYYYPKNNSGGEATVAVYPISVGRGEWATPVTTSRITGRAKDPIWYPPRTIRAEHAARGDILPTQVPPGPDNPLGAYLLMLDLPSYFIHGTNKRFGIGMQVTHGCVRMYPQDIEQLVKQVANNTEVTIVNQPVKTGWQDGQLYLEVHPPLQTSDSEPENKRADIIQALVEATSELPETKIDWAKVDEVLAAASGIPEKVGEISNETLPSGV